MGARLPSKGDGAMKEMETPGTETEKDGGKTHHRRGRHARGGKAKDVNEYNAQGSPEVKEAEDEAEDFNKGGKAKRKDGGHAEGEAAHMRADRMPRGRKAGGRTHEGHGGHHHDGHEHEVEHEGAHGVHHHGAHGHAVHHHGSGDVHVHKRKGGEVHEKRAGGGRTGSNHSPYSSGRHLSGETGGGAANGHEGQKVPAEPE